MKEKQVRNKLRDMIGDYYLTNRMVEKENNEANKKNEADKNNEACKYVDPRKFSKTEKIYISVIAVGLVLIILRYIFF